MRESSPRVRRVQAWLVLLLGWFHGLLAPIGEWLSVSALGAFEESVRTVVRGWFGAGSRYIHTFASLILSAFSGQRYGRAQRRAATARQQAWSSWWTQAGGTFNALLEREGLSSPGAGDKGHDEDNGDRKMRLDGDENTEERAQPISAPPSRGARWKVWRRRKPSLPQSISLRDISLFTSAADSLTTARRGLFEDARLAVDLAIAKVFNALRRITRAAFFLDRRSSSSVPTRSSSFSSGSGHSFLASAASGTPRRHSKSSRGQLFGPKPWEDLHEFAASDAILRAGYPLEEHSVTTPDGYVLQLHRIPRRGARDVVLYVHGVMDTSLGWVARGTGGSAAFAAHDAGFDVWLSNTRANPPRLNVNPARRGARYWHYSADDLATVDLPAQIDFIHKVKMSELAAETRIAPPMEAFTEERKSTGRGQAFQGQEHHRNPGTTAGSHSQSTARSRQQTEWSTSGVGNHQAATGRDTGIFDGANPCTLLHRRRQSLTRAATTDSVAHPGRRRSDDRSFDTDARALRRVRSEAMPQEYQLRWHIDQDEDEDDAGFIDPGDKVTATYELPYRLQAVGHSLGAACLLMCAVSCRMRGTPLRLQRLVLLSPAGFHPRIPLVVRSCKWIMPAACWVVDRVRPGRGVGLRLPSPALRWVAFKLFADLRHSPALLDLTKAALRVATSGDSSEWYAQMSLPHYSPQAMPAVSLHTANSFAQWARDGSFRFYDHGSAEANISHHGAPEPPSVAENYHLLQHLPVDLVAGTTDGLIPPEGVREHERYLSLGGVDVTYREFRFGHLEFTFGVGEEVVHHVMRRLRRDAMDVGIRTGL